MMNGVPFIDVGDNNDPQIGLKVDKKVIDRINKDYDDNGGNIPTLADGSVLVNRFSGITILDQDHI